MPTNVVPLRNVAVAATLRSCQLFFGLPPADLEEIAKFSLMRNVAKGAYLFREGDRSEGFYVVQRGAINVHRVSANGKEQVIYIFRAGESLAEASLAGERGYPANARAIEPSSLIVVPKAPFLELIGRRPELGLRMLGSMSQHLRVLVGLVEDLTLKDVETRLLNWVLKRCANDATGAVDVELGMAKRVLAGQLAATSETLSRTFAKLRDENLMDVRGSTVHVPDIARLQARFRLLLGEA
ncbi:MAG TPA: Crp/Fnr family transcriptional regulator [Opitutaceae bacterium]|nr:Crp/Fnr family transcriptional regulator [Opitutaceae bacterium]